LAGLPNSYEPGVIAMTRVMGILNTTPDSFSDGGRWTTRERALRHALDMAAAGVDLIDVGGESTRPGSSGVDAAEELERVVPVIEAIVAETDVPVSVDTSKPQVMEAAVRAGAVMINDVNALRSEGALPTAARLGVPVCLMHMQGQPRDMQIEPRYEDVVGEVARFLQARAAACEAQGIPAERILIDPGFGFGKSLEHNVELFRAIPRLSRLGYPLLVGVSRKSMLGALTGKPVEERMAASVAAAVLAARRGAAVVRVHDVAETVDALKVAEALSP
jgi:dihydropteroate synthase